MKIKVALHLVDPNRQIQTHLPFAFLNKQSFFLIPGHATSVHLHCKKRQSFTQFWSQTESLHFLRQIGRLLQAAEDLTVASCIQRLTTYTATEPQNTTLECHMFDWQQYGAADLYRQIG